MRADRLNAVVADYRITDFLGAGGMGEVYRAVNQRSGAVVAVKFLSAGGLNAKDLARFYHEARVQAALHHPNIARLHEMLNVDGQPCLVMEYVDGESLADRIGRSGRLPPREALAFLRDLAAAVAEIHAGGVIHRDLKPANVRVTGQGQIKLLDFGIATSAHLSGLTMIGNVIGTPQYLSPEQLVGQPATAASDVWALGLILYEMATGRPPFDGATTSEIRAQIEAGTYAPPSRLVIPGSPALARGIDALVKDCLVRDARRRIGTASTLVARATALLDQGANVTAAPRRPPSPTFMTTRARAGLDAIERRWQWWAAAAAVVVLAVLFLGLGRDEAATGHGGGASGDNLQLAVEHINVVNGPADVYVDGRPIGATPVDFPGRIGQTIQIELRKIGHESRHARVTMSAEHTSTLEMIPSRTP
jgi:eukaryotic-like serine/threonine-protein kinase